MTAAAMAEGSGAPQWRTKGAHPPAGTVTEVQNVMVESANRIWPRISSGDLPMMIHCMAFQWHFSTAALLWDTPGVEYNDDIAFVPAGEEAQVPSVHEPSNGQHRDHHHGDTHVPDSAVDDAAQGRFFNVDVTLEGQHGPARHTAVL
ncbi:unnamed protein product [Polarella glacialis]|uniref:Uncharacterized protein n=1 Tax=Polarella glacialis TaxID=89957 RepID=A0A813E6A8_POLGL|nr:unnamed protein product [Polarella glacialis]